MHVISVISTKGGEGKSTHSANLAGFCADAGLKTLLIDGDYAQPTASSYYTLRYEAPCGLFEMLMQTVDLSRPEQLISQTCIDNLDLVISNDPHEHLKTAMMHAPDGRIRLRNLLQHPLFATYDVIIIDSQGARSIMLELVLLATTHTAVAMVKPILPDVREFLRGTVTLMEDLLPYRGFGISLPPMKILVNCMDYDQLADEALGALTTIITDGTYSKTDIPPVSLLETKIYDLKVYKLGHTRGLPVHRLEYLTDRKSLPAAQTMHDLACELFPEWRDRFDAVLQNQPKGDK
ncbi:ParA family protein [Citrobacter freundii]|uniref:ParA family protein n=1 Tax=Citrobacter freundii TaxID=546 RepID=UPI0015EAE70B|nr:ParA family protein [Citrobacter freundii]QMD26721.1 ParA family protein [Citrobacter freundii]